MNASQTTARLDVRTFWLGVSAVIFAVLLAAHATRPSALLPAAQAGVAVDSREFALVTAGQADGNEAVYVLDKRSGLLAFISWNTSASRPEVVDVKPLQQAFGGR